jgi:serine/threonine-protein kinase
LQLPGVGELLADGRFELLGKLGEGGMSTVFVADDHMLGREVALKLLIPRYVGRPDREQRLINEAEYLRRVQGHPNVIQFIDAGRLQDRNGWPWLATEVMVGQDLDWVFIRGKVESPQVVSIARQIASALAACHEAGVVHRDVTPTNVFLLEDQRTVKLFDFSHAADLHAPKVVVGEAERLTGVFETPGTAGYMGPEQVMNAPPDISMDAFGFGVLLFRLITGRDPYHQFSDRDAFIMAQREGLLEPPRLHAWAYSAPDELADLVHDCTQRDGSQRPTMPQILARLDALASSSSIETPAAASARVPAASAVEDSTSVQLPFARPPHLREAPAAEIQPALVFDAPRQPEPEPHAGADPGEITVPATPRSRRRIAAALLLVLLVIGVLSGLTWSAVELGRPTTDLDPDRAARDEPGDGDEPNGEKRVPGPEPDSGEPSNETDTGSGYEAVPQIPTDTPAVKPKPKPTVPEPTCEGVEADARAAAQRRKWATVIQLTEHKRCWASNDERTRLRVNALLSSRRNAECVKAGRGSRDPEVLSMVKTCEALVEANPSGP